MALSMPSASTSIFRRAKRCAGGNCCLKSPWMPGGLLGSRVMKRSNNMDKREGFTSVTHRQWQTAGLAAAPRPWHRMWRLRAKTTMSLVKNVANLDHGWRLTTRLVCRPIQKNDIKQLSLTERSIGRRSRTRLRPRSLFWGLRIDQLGHKSKFRKRMGR